MADAADNPVVQRAIRSSPQSLQLAASAQLRNMATLGGNVLQRTRCTYFRDRVLRGLQQAQSRVGLRGARTASIGRMRCSECSDACIATYPGDFAAGADRARRDGRNVIAAGEARTIPFARLHRHAGRHGRTLNDTLRPGELIAAFSCPAATWTRRSLYLKVRDRESYEFALASAAVALDLR